MTQKEFFKAVSESAVSEDLKTYALESIAKIDERNRKKSSKQTKKQKENEPIKAKILDYLEDHSKTIGTDLAEALEENKSVIIGLCGTLVKEGKLIKEEVKIKGVGKRIAYSIAITNEDNEEGAEEEGEN